MNLGYVTCSFTSKASYGSWRALTTFSSRIGTTNPIGQFRVAYATRICPSALYGSWVAPFFACIGTMNRCGEIVARASRPHCRAHGRDAPPLPAGSWRAEVHDSFGCQGRG